VFGLSRQNGPGRFFNLPGMTSPDMTTGRRVKHDVVCRGSLSNTNYGRARSALPEPDPISDPLYEFEGRERYRLSTVGQRARIIEASLPAKEIRSEVSSRHLCSERAFSTSFRPVEPRRLKPSQVRAAFLSGGGVA
jgi:hypothetical protein